MNAETTTTTEDRTPAHQFSTLLSPTRRGARLARLLTVAHLGCRGLPTEQAATIVAELAANAVLHGRVPGRDFRLDLTLTGPTLRIEVTDTRDDQLPDTSPQPPTPHAESGRGLLLVAALADRWGVHTGPTPRKTVWAELTLPT
ncbi:ATP-binding protein [Streptomyces sp. JJ66]|uniref:ATP-binding protein n=1 Tax=Streptomyces sp. JJ66 TaxID=2803843 RepID=UPI0035B29D17